jgi:hypothetical protein
MRRMATYAHQPESQEKLARRGIEPRHVNEALRSIESPRRAKFGAYAVIGRDAMGRPLLVIFHLRQRVARVATARVVTS